MIMGMYMAMLCGCTPEGRQVKVSFADGNTVVAQENYEYGATYGELPVLEGEGFRVFGGWFTSARGGEQVTAETEVTDPVDHTLYAHWIFDGKIESIATGNDCAFAVGEDGSLWQWGSDIADGYPVQLMEEQHIEKVFAAGDTYFALDDAGKLWSWGDNHYGQAGTGSTGDEVTEPAQVACEAVFAEVAGTTMGSVFGIDTQGDLWAWGYNRFGQLGDGTRENRMTPVRVMQSTKFSRLAASSSVAAVDENGDVWSIYDPYSSSDSAPTKVAEAMNITDIAVYNSEIVVLDENGTVWSMDRNGKTQALLEGKPIVEIGLGGGTGISGGMRTSYFARTQSGDLWVWGANYHGQLGIGSCAETATPVEVTGYRIAELSPGRQFTVAVDADGKLLAWGTGDIFGNGIHSYSVLPEKVMQPSEYVHIASALHTLAIDADGKLWTWGRNNYGQLGDGTQTSRTAPEQIMPGTRFLDVAAGNSHSVAIDADGQLWAWGSNQYGQVGDGSIEDEIASGGPGLGFTENYLTPVRVRVASETSVRFSKVEAGNTANAALDEEGYLWSWGNFTSTASRMSDSMKFTAIAAGNEHFLALEENGRLWAWGNNDYGQLGGGSTINRSTPVQVGRGTEFVQIAAGGDFSAAIDADGNLWTWGSNTYGQLGNGTSVESAVPVQIMKGTAFAQIACGTRFMLALDANGRLWAWGNNDYGQIGNDSRQSRPSPVQIMKGVACETILTGMYSCYVIDADGALWTWGRNDYGQLCNGEDVIHLTPEALLLTY